MNVPDGDDVGEEDDETEQISVPRSSKPLQHSTISKYTLASAWPHGYTIYHLINIAKGTYLSFAILPKVNKLMILANGEHMQRVIFVGRAERM